METTEQYLQNMTLSTDDGTPRKAFYDLVVYKDIQAARVAAEYFGNSAAFIDASGKEAFFLGDTVISFNDC